MPYIFFKIKNCLNDDLLISCNDRIRKMLHNSGYVTQVSDLWPVGLLYSVYEFMSGSLLLTNLT